MAWTRADQIVIDHTQCGGSDSTNWAFVFQGTYAGLKTTGNGGSVTSASGFDIIFAADALGATPYSFERVSWDGTTGICEFWVKIPTLSHTADTNLYILSGNAAITTDQQSAASAWSNSFIGVRHLQASSVESIGGATSTDTAITYSGANGQIQQGAGFNGSTSKIVCSGGAANYSSSAFTVSLWAKASSFSPAYSAVETNSDGNGRLFAIKSTGKLACYVTTTGTTRDYDGTGTNTLVTGTWYHLAITWDGATVTGYVNGVLDGSATGSSFTYHNASAEQIGNDPSTAGRFFNGAIDEYHQASVVRSADWLLAEYNNQNLPWHFYKTPTLAGGNPSTANAKITNTGLTALLSSPAPYARTTQLGMTAILGSSVPHAQITQLGLTAIFRNLSASASIPPNVIQIIT